jgi:hypothetical protein
MLINAKNATKRITPPTGIRILKNTGLMTKKGQKFQNELKPTRKLTVRGERKTKEEALHTLPWLEPSVMAVYFGCPALGVENKNPSLIMKITTNLLKLCGFVNRVTNNDTKKSMNF